MNKILWGAQLIISAQRVVFVIPNEYLTTRDSFYYKIYSSDIQGNEVDSGDQLLTLTDDW